MKSLLLAAGCLAFCCAQVLGAQNDTWALSLAEAQAIARERNHDLQLAHTAISSARANAEVAGAPPNPSLTIATSSISSASNSQGAVWKRPIDTVLHVDQLLERGDKRALRKENAEQLAKAARADYVDVARQLRALVAQSYIDLKLAQERRSASLETLRLLDAMLSAAQIRKKAGDIAGADVERVRVDTLRAQNEVAAAEGELSRARRSLAFLLGVNERVDSLEASDPWPELSTPPPLSDQALGEIVSRRPDVQAAMSRIDAAEAGSRLAQSLRTRDVTVGMQYEHFPQPGDPNNSSGNSVGFSVQLPLFTRYYYQGEILAAEAARTRAQQALLRVHAVAESEIRTAWSSLTAAAERVRRNRDELLIAAEKAADAAEFAYRNGAAGVMDVLDSRRTLRATRLDALAALADLGKAWAAWLAATDAAAEATTAKDMGAASISQESRQ